MNAKLSLTSLLVVVVVLSGTLRESSAERLNSNKFSKRSALGKREGGGGSRIERRDLADFQTQINDATYFYLGSRNITLCPTVPCVGTVSKTLCPAFCKVNKTAYGQIVNALINCYVGGICNKTFTNIKFTNVNISIASGAYDGQCYIYGPQVQMTLKNQTNDVSTYTQAVAYDIYVDMFYDFEGFSLYCRPNLPCPTCTNSCGGQTGGGQTGGGQTGGGQTGGGQTGGSHTGGGQTGGSGGGGPSCCGTDVLTEVVCLVQQLVGSLGLQLNLLGCDCNCGGSWFGKRQAAGSPAPFQIPITVTQEEILTILALYQGGIPFGQLTSVYAETTVTFASTLPTPYADDITNGIQTVFQDYGTFYSLQANFRSIIAYMLNTLFQDTCPKCS